MDLVIVESPTKARKLAGYLGKEFQVEASVGHVRDLPSSELGVDLEHNFEPTYVVNDDKKKVITQLKKLAKEATTIYLATDPDREGEAIAWHLQSILSEGKNGVKASVFRRATFHEITKSAVLEAIGQPAELKMQLVDAQQARRVVDRLVGYQISPVLWRKVRRGLSAGRVQSVALRLIVEREREIQAFIPEEYWQVLAAISTTELQPTTASKYFSEGKPVENLPTSLVIGEVVEVNGTAYAPKKEADVTGVVENLQTASYQVTTVERKTRQRASLPPFTTSTLQQAAANRLGMTSKQTMRLAQQLYEEGLITYHRTDSVNLSQQSLSMARDHISKQYGPQYLPEKPRYFANTSKNAQEAHEAIRVTELTVSPEQVAGQGSLTSRHSQLYDLIWRRFVASQMNSAVYDQTSVLVTATSATTSDTYTLKVNGSTLTFDGWMKLFPGGDDVLLPVLNEKQPLWLAELDAQQKFTQPPARFNDASLVKELEKRGIGRPSTYASIISVIEERGYVSRDQKRFVATPVGMTVSDFLLKYFATIMDYAFTAEMEEDLDRIARGEKAWKAVVKAFYTPLAEKIAFATTQGERAQVPVEPTGESCPKCGATEKGEIVIRTGRFGKFKSCSRYPECDFTDRLVTKLEGMSCPLCHQGDVIMKNTRWGKQFYGCSRYPECDWASWQPPQAGQNVTAEEWAEQKRLRAERAEKRAATMGKTKPAGKTSVKPKAKTKTKSTKKKPAAKKTASKTVKKTKSAA